MKASERTLQQLLHAGDQYVIPVFQRYYTWKKRDWERLWDDISALLEPGEEERRHFLGSIVCVPEHHQPGNVPAYQVIDGQQRLTTLSILLCSLRTVAKEVGFEDLAAEINESYLVHRFKKGREHYKLFLRLRDRIAYSSLVDTGTAPAESRVDTAHKHFVKAVRDYKKMPDEEALRSLFAAVTTRLDLVAITLDRESPYKIFKSLNSTGVDLEQGDLIRNHVFMALRLDDQDDFDDQHWRPLEGHFEKDGKLDGTAFTGFFRDVLLRNGKYIGKNATHEAFEATYPLSQIQPLRLVPHLRDLASRYDIIEGRASPESSEVGAALSSVRSLNVSTSYPLLLQLLSMHEAGNLERVALVRCLRMISGFVLRRYVCNESSRAYSRWFCVVCKELGNNPERSLSEFFRAKGWPDDTRFQQALINYQLYSSAYLRPLLEGLEHALQRPSERVVLDKCSVEHILPQSISNDRDGRLWREMLGSDWKEQHAAWLHTLGNLTLVGHDYNSTMSNRSFDAKIPSLTSSRVYLNKYFTADPRPIRWTSQEIQERAKQLVAKASEIWPGPG